METKQITSTPRNVFARSLPLLALVVLANQSLAQAQSCQNPVACENQIPGDGNWNISGSGDPTLQGFATDISVNAGQTVYFKINSTASNYNIAIYRMGYYGGQGARQVATTTPSAVLPQSQPACLTDPSTYLLDCGNWALSASWAVPSTAVSGYYFARLVRPDTGGASHIFFIVRNDGSHSKILLQASDLTWQAYNDYGGHSLYGGAGTFDLPNRAYKVSYNRPSDTRNFENWTWLFNAEYPMIRWIESNGYDVSYFTGVDAIRNSNLITNHQIYLSVGHDEYWAGPQRTNIQAALAAGVNLAFFSGNEVFWKTRWENSIDGTNTPYRTMVCYKETLAGAVIDPNDPPTWTGTWADPRFSPPGDGGLPQNQLTGTLFKVNGPGSDNTDLSIQVTADDGKLRFWRNTSIATQSPGQTVKLPGGTLGYEWDVDGDNGFRPAGLIPMSTATYSLTTDYLLDYGATYGPGTATHRLTMYRASNGALVFGAGTVQWSWGLDYNHDNSGTNTDVRMQQATVNLFADMGVQPTTLQPGLVGATPSTDTTPPSSTITSPASGATFQPGATVLFTGTATDTGGGVVGGVEVSLDGGKSWHPATGRASWSYSWIASPGSNTVLSRAVDDSGNLETPGPGIVITVPNPQISLDTVVSANSPSAALTVSTPSFSTAFGKELLLAFISGDYLSGANTTVTGVSGGGLTWALVARANAQSGTAEIWRAFASSPLSNVTATATLSQSVIASITVQTFSGVDTTGTNGSGAIGATKTANSISGAPTASLVTTRNGSWVFGVGSDYDDAITRTPGPSQTLINQYLTPDGDTYWAQMQNAQTPASGTTVTINDTAPNTDRYNLAICEVLPSLTPSWSISGSITPASAGSGATISLSGAATASTTANGSGTFSFASLANGNYVITPSKTGFAFTPTSQSTTIAGQNVTGVNFSATAIPTYTVSGSITGLLAGSTAQVTLNAVGESASYNATVATDASGNFSFSGVPSNSYLVTPSKNGYTFTPPNQSISVTSSNVSGISFSATALPTWAISGSVSVAGATVTLSGSSNASVQADGAGNYSFTGLPNGNYTVTPQATGFLFTPTSQSVPVNSANVTGVNFSASPVPTWNISGTISPASISAGATVSLTGAATASTTVNGAGNYAFTGLMNGSYTVTPSQTGVSFSPVSMPETISNASVTNANFTASAVAPPIAADATVSGDGSASATSIATPTFSTVASNELLLAFVSADYLGGTNTKVTSVTGAGLTWVLVVRTNAQSGTAEIWRAFAPAALTNVAVTAALSNSVVATITVRSYTGADTSGTNGSGAIGAINSASARSGAPSGSIVTTRNKSVVAGVGTDFDNAIARTVGAGQTLIHQSLPAVGDTFWSQTETSAIPNSGTTVTINDTAPKTDRYNLSICEILQHP